MFDRSKTDNARQSKTAVVEVKLDDGRTMSGRIIFYSSGSLFEALNANDAFLDFEPFEGQREFISKLTLRAVRLIQTPPAPKLAKASQDNFDPHAVLSVGHGANAEELRSAYLQQSKKYHPDRYANTELPDEIRDYLQIMARRVNTAYEALQCNQPVARPVRSEPIWQSR